MKFSTVFLAVVASVSVAVPVAQSGGGGSEDDSSSGGALGLGILGLKKRQLELVTGLLGGQ